MIIIKNFNSFPKPTENAKNYQNFSLNESPINSDIRLDPMIIKTEIQSDNNSEDLNGFQTTKSLSENTQKLRTPSKRRHKSNDCDDNYSCNDTNDSFKSDDEFNDNSNTSSKKRKSCRSDKSGLFVCEWSGCGQQFTNNYSL
jgi:hypothetical protein